MERISRERTNIELTAEISLKPSDFTILFLRSFQKYPLLHASSNRETLLSLEICLLVPFHLFARPISPTTYPFDFRFYISRGRKSGYYFSVFAFKKREISRNRFCHRFPLSKSTPAAISKRKRNVKIEHKHT